MKKYRNVVQDSNGNAIRSATITVTDYPSGTTSTIYSDNSGTSLSNPFTASSEDGAFEFYAPSGRYTTSIDATGYDIEGDQDISLEESITRDTKAEIQAMTFSQYHAGTKVFITSADGGEFTVRYNATPATYADDGGSYCGTQFIPSGGDGTIWIVRDFDGPIWAHWFGLFTTNSAAVNTTNMQKAIDSTLASEYAELHTTAGKYQFTTLDFTDSGGSTRAISGKLKLVGAGQLNISDTYGTSTDEYGTILESTISDSTNAFVVSSGTTTTRKVEFENLTLIYGGTGYAIEADYCPEFSMEKVSVRCTATGSKALLIQDVWFSYYKRCYIIADNAITSTVAGVTFDATIFGGSVKFEDCLIEGFNDNFWCRTSTNFVDITFDNCSIQEFNRYGWFIEGALKNLSFLQCYAESSSATNIVKIAPVAGSVVNFSIDGIYIVGGTTTATWLTGAAIDLDDVLTYDIRKVKYYRPWTALVNHAAAITSVTGKLDTLDIIHDNVAALPTGPLYLLTGATNTQFSASNYLLTASSKLAIYDPASDRCAQFDNKATINSTMSNGAFTTAAVSATTYDMAGASPLPMVVLVTATGAGSGTIQLPRASGVNDTDTRYIMNDPASTQSLLITNGSLGVTIHTLAAGDGAVCFADKTNDKWMIIPGAGSYGT